MKVRHLLPFIAFLIFDGCSKSELTPPPQGNDSNLVNTTDLPFTGAATIKTMEGIYKLVDGNDGLGSRFVCKVSKFKVSFFSEKEGIFIILKYGYKSDGSIQFSGFWRYSEKPDQGNIQFSMADSEGAADLLGGLISTNLKMQGTFSGQTMTLQYEKAFSTFAASNPYMIFAHHGMQTVADPPFAENSIEAAYRIEDYGVNGWEADVRMTKDNVPILIHDPTINVRLTQKGPLFGSWDQYGFEFISQYVTLIDGQKVPSVEQALNAVIDSTTLKYVWLDIKGNPGIFKYLEPIVRHAYERAQSKGRDVIIFAGLPSSSIIDELNSQPTYKAGNPNYAYSLPLPTLAEETMDKAISTNSQYFGPRYSLGLLLDDVARGHANGIQSISWTLNAKNLIKDYLVNGDFDGCITDYPAYVVYDFYTMF